MSHLDSRGGGGEGERFLTLNDKERIEKNYSRDFKIA